MAGNPGGDDGDGTVSIPRCPHCKKMFFDFQDMVSHIAKHEGGERKGAPTSEQAMNQNDADDLTHILKSRF